ncbi:hypothetical protein ACXR2W_13080 [Leucobacter sp. HY1908]
MHTIGSNEAADGSASEVVIDEAIYLMRTQNGLRIRNPPNNFPANVANRVDIAPLRYPVNAMFPAAYQRF